MDYQLGLVTGVAIIGAVVALVTGPLLFIVGSFANRSNRRH